MNIYGVLDLINDADNTDTIADILDRWEFQTSARSPEVKDQVKASAIEIANLGEGKVYQYIKDAYGLNM